MSRRTIKIIIIIGIVIGILFGIFFYLESNANPSGSNNGSGFNFGSLFGKSSGTTNTTNSSTNSVDLSASNTSSSFISSNGQSIPKLRHITALPIGGDAFVTENIYATSSATNTPVQTNNGSIIGTQEVIRWIDRGTGFIFETSPYSMIVNRISNTTVTKIYEALFTDLGNSVIIRGLVGDSDTIQTQYGQLTVAAPTSMEQSLELNTLPTNITALALSPTKDKIFYILPSGTRGTISDTDGSNKISEFDSPFYEWLVDWPNANGIVLNTKPSGLANGFAYLLNPKTKAVTKIIGDTPGLTTLVSPDLKWALIGSSPQGTIALSILNMKDGSTQNLSLKTLPEKCVWSKLDTDMLYCAVPQSLAFGTYPDIWYQGTISFSDSLWSIDLQTGQTKLILQPSDYTQDPLDMTNLILNKEENYITFINKNDLSLWGYELSTSTPTVTTINSTSTVNVQ